MTGQVDAFIYPSVRSLHLGQLLPITPLPSYCKDRPFVCRLTLPVYYPRSSCVPPIGGCQDTGCVCTSMYSFDGLVPSQLHTRISRQPNVQTEPQAQSGSIVIGAFVCEGFRRPFKGLERCQRAHTSPWKESKVRVEHPAKQIRMDALVILKY